MIKYLFFLKLRVAPKILAVWILSICISIPPVLGWRTNTQQITETIVGNATKHCQVFACIASVRG